MALLAALSRRRRSAGAAEARGGRLRRRLTAAGPLAAGFGIHLGSRVDLLSGTDCAALLAIPDRAPASRRMRVVELHRAASWVARCEARSTRSTPVPFDSGLLFQWHHARLPGGESGHGAAGPPGARDGAGELAAGWRDGLGRSSSAGSPPASCRRRPAARSPSSSSGSICARRPRQLARAGGGDGRLALGRGTRGASAALRAAHPGALHDPRPDPGVAGPARGRARARPRRRLGRIWLSMALAGDLFPVEPRGRNVAYLAGGRVAFLDGAVHRLPRASRPALREYSGGGRDARSGARGAGFSRSAAGRPHRSPAARPHPPHRPVPRSRLGRRR